MRLRIDIETYSSEDLRTVGVYKYSESPDFLILMAAWSLDDGPIQIALTQQEIFDIPGLWDPTVTKVAHNAQFERVCFSHFCHTTAWCFEYLDPEQWHDTQALAGEYGLPQSLEDLAKRICSEQKDKAGTALIKLFCMPNRKGQRNLPEDYPEEWLKFIEYCKQDVVTLVEVDEKLGYWPTEMERQIFLADQHINDDGIAADLTMARLAVESDEQNRMVQELEITNLTGVTNPGSPMQLINWLQSSGLEIDNMRAETVSHYLENVELDYGQRRVLEVRQELALAASKKYVAVVAGASPDGRLRGQFKFFGAHTGRWSGRGVQLQNLPRAHMESKDEANAAIADLYLGFGADSQTLKALVRAVLVGPFTVVDYAAIEARVIAWLAGEQWALDAFYAGRDIYVETAQRMGGLTRYQGKIAVLALGFAGGLGSLRAMGAEGDDDELQMLVDQWRRANRRITTLWRTLGDSLAEPGPVGKHLRVSREGSTVRLHLPSGRAIVYHGMRWERYRVVDTLTGRATMKEGWRYDDPRGAGRISQYGGRLAENATQAVARDILGEALVRLRERGFKVVGHVHDEVLVEGRHNVKTVAGIMSEPPGWAKGLPISAEGFVCTRYRKG